jgi:glycosyltransferase involved in cell wall biosynthesis
MTDSVENRKPMAVRLVDLDSRIPALEGSDGYGSAMVFFRFRGSVVGRKILPFEDGFIAAGTLEAAARELGVDADGNRTSRSRYLLPGEMVTVAVCTRNRSDELKRCLESLLAVDWTPLEILVVDNCPSDDETLRTVLQYPRVQYALCRDLGLDRARNMALRLAQGEIVAFTDDDVRVEPSWIKGLVANFRDPMVAVVTGITLPAELETAAQVDFELGTSFIRNFTRREFSLIDSDPLHVASVGAGANMAVRVSLLKEIGCFDPRLDGGTPTKSGGDHELFFRTLNRGYRIVFDPSAIVWHYHRRTVAEAVGTLYGYGTGVGAWWTKALFELREFSLLLAAPRIFWQYHLRRYVGSLRGTDGSPHLKYTWAELRGALAGPFAYLRSVLSPVRCAPGQEDPEWSA